MHCLVSAPNHPGSRCCSHVLTWQETRPQEAFTALLAGKQWATGTQGMLSLSQVTLGHLGDSIRKKATIPPSWHLTWQNHHHHHEMITYFQVPVLAIWMPVKKAINQDKHRAKWLKWHLKRKFIFKHRTQKIEFPFFPKKYNIFEAALTKLSSFNYFSPGLQFLFYILNCSLRNSFFYGRYLLGVKNKFKSSLLSKIFSSD